MLPVEDARLAVNPTVTYRIYVGTAYDRAEVEAIGDDHATLLSNMRGNGWDRVVQTRLGNWQPVEEKDVVIGDVRACLSGVG